MNLPPPRIEGSAQVRVGRTYASALPSGYAIRTRIGGEMYGAGKRKLRNVSRQEPPRMSVSPRNHIRKVIVGIVGSSILGTLARTSV